MQEQPQCDAFLNSLPSDVRNKVRVACEDGLGSAIQQIYRATLRHNLVFQDYDPEKYDQESLALVPHRRGDHRLIRIRMKPYAGRLKMYLQADEFATTYHVTETEVETVLGRKGWIYYTSQNIGEFVQRLDKLFDLIESREGKQASFFDLLPDTEISDAFVLTEDVPTRPIYIEGGQTDVVQTEYERNQAARDACLDHYGPTCIVCDFNFEEVYGEIGVGFIHVHHRTPISHFDNEHEVNPIEDLCPVCPNCHAMLHRHDPPYTTDELQDMRESKHGRK